MAVELIDPVLLVLTSFDQSHEDYDYAAVRDRILAGADDPRFLKLATLDLSQCSMHVQRIGVAGNVSVDAIAEELAQLKGSEQALGRTIILLTAADRAAHGQLAQAALRELATGYAEPVKIPSRYDELLTVWADLGGEWIVVLFDARYSSEGRKELANVLSSESFVTVESLWHKTVAKMNKHENVRAQFTSTQWAKGLKQSLDEDTEIALMHTAAEHGTAYQEVTELDAAVKYVAAALYSLDAIAANIHLVKGLLLDPLAQAIAEARGAAAGRFLRRVERDQSVVTELANAARWRSEQDQEKSLDQIQVMGLLITVFGLSLAVAQLWAASLSTEEEARSLATFAKLLVPPLFICSALAFVAWLSGGTLKQFWTKARASVRRLFSDGPPDNNVG
jgi:hypothetical protein